MDLNRLFISLCIVTVLGFWFVRKTLPILQSIGCRQVVRSDGPKTHLVKQGTPTMGGIYFLILWFIYLGCIYVFASNQYLDGNLISLSCLFVLFAILGFIDDFVKIKYGKGISMALKMLCQILTCSIWSFYFMPHHIINIPGFLSIELALIPSIIWGIFVIVGTVNAINFTDGLDGLMIQTVMVVLVGFTCIAYSLSQSSGILLTNILALLMLITVYPYNIYPARLFVGDTGSMGIGALVAGLALLQQIEFPLVIMGCVFVIETLSVAIQIISFRLFRRRVFKMAPIHHSFELSGWEEKDIVRLFTIITLVGTSIGLWWVLG